MLYNDECTFTEIYDQEKKAKKDSSSKLSSYDFYGTEKKEQKIKNRIFICPNCHYIPKIKYLNNNLLEIECQCREIKNIPPRKFISYYGKKKSYKKYINCDIHQKQNFIYYYINCFCNLCKECANL